mmetsp:Transcript_40665/g.41514  ORF Transcript_40665/g.41514 Transcript_40665/m.41514 type:complete len:135 (+) Transcript_40665:145-549(+)
MAKITVKILVIIQVLYLDPPSSRSDLLSLSELFFTVLVLTVEKYFSLKVRKEGLVVPFDVSSSDTLESFIGCFVAVAADIDGGSIVVLDDDRADDTDVVPDAILVEDGDGCVESVFDDVDDVDEIMLLANVMSA